MLREASWRTVVETPAYLAAAESILSEEERAGVVDFVARYPERGVALGGGLWKLRVALHGRGRRGGARAVYLLAGDDMPVFLLTIFAKNEKSDLGPAERREIVEAAKAMANEYGSSQ